MDIRVSMNLAFFEKIVLFLSTPVLATLVTGHVVLDNEIKNNKARHNLSNVKYRQMKF